MGWHNHVECVETKCLDCGETDTWMMWSEVALFRYGKKGPLAFLGHDDSTANRCPYCGSTNGEAIDDEEWLDYD